MLNEFINSVLIIDDKEDEVSGLIELLKKHDIWVKHINPPKEKEEIENKFNPIRNRKLIFLDLKLDETKSTKDNISTIIRPLLTALVGQDFGSYGIVMWTRNEEHIDEFKEKIILDKEKYTLPLFVIGLDKQKYLLDGFDELLDDLNNKLQQNIASNFFINWSTLIEQGRDTVIQSIFELTKGYSDFDNQNLEFLLFHLAKNHIGLHESRIEEYPLYKEVYKAFLGLLEYEVSSNLDDLACQLFSDLENLSYVNPSLNLSKSIHNQFVLGEDKIDLKEVEKNSNHLKLCSKICKKMEIITQEKEEDIKVQIDEFEHKLKQLKQLDDEIYILFSKLNTKLLIDEFPNNPLIMPGNIYKIIDETGLLIPSYKNKSDTPIMIELTPPCDFANNKYAYPKFIGGFITKYSENRLRSLASMAIYTETFPLNINGQLSIIAFDFRYISTIPREEVEDINKYKMIFRAKDNLFADILQKMSSYTARLGLSIIR